MKNETDREQRFGSRIPIFPIESIISRITTHSTGSLLAPSILLGRFSNTLNHGLMTMTACTSIQMIPA